jgi:hypothetical protein
MKRRCILLSALARSAAIAFRVTASSLAPTGKARPRRRRCSQGGTPAPGSRFSDRRPTTFGASREIPPKPIGPPARPRAVCLPPRGSRPRFDGRPRDPAAIRSVFRGNLLGRGDGIAPCAGVTEIADSFRSA